MISFVKNDWTYKIVCWKTMFLEFSCKDKIKQIYKTGL